MRHHAGNELHRCSGTADQRNRCEPDPVVDRPSDVEFWLLGVRSSLGFTGHFGRRSNFRRIEALTRTIWPHPRTRMNEASRMFCLTGLKRGLSSIGNLELVEDPRDVVLDCFEGQAQCPCDLCVAGAFSK